LARIALDAMGGDFAPKATIAGALLALQELDGAHAVQLVGQTRVIEAELDKLIFGESERRVLLIPLQGEILWMR